MVGHNRQDLDPPFPSSSEAVKTRAADEDVPLPHAGALFTSFHSPSAPKSPGAFLGFPFTVAQWKELERQAMIYKYMMASVPVPPDLLLPTPQNDPSPSKSSLGNDSMFHLNLRFTKEAEPGRCKRTDGKKWRCSRDVAPNQKYCERHMNRGRPRSRKPVEAHHHPFHGGGNRKTRPPPPSSAVIPGPAAGAGISVTHLPGSAIQPDLTPLFVVTPDANISAPSYKEQNRCLNWTMDASEQQWQHFLLADTGLSNVGSMFYQQDCMEEPLNLLPYTDFAASESVQQVNDCNFFLNPDLMCLEKHPQVDIQRDFIDAWSNDNPKANNISNESSLSSQGNLSPSSLTLSMAMTAGEVLDEEMSRLEMGLRVGDSNYQNLHDWASPGSWAGSAPGGPLAEVLRWGSAALCSDPASPYAGHGDSGGTPATGASSPSGVLQRTVPSVSDSSGCTSPSIAARPVAAEVMPFQWLS